MLKVESTGSGRTSVFSECRGAGYGGASEFENSAGRDHLRVGAAGTGCGLEVRVARVADFAEVLVLDAHTVLTIEKILCSEAAEETGIAELAAGAAGTRDKTTVVKSQSCLGKEPSQPAENGEVPGEIDGRHRREPHARHFIDAILGDPTAIVVLVVKFTDCGIAQLGRPIPVD